MIAASDLVRPTVVTTDVIARRWCPNGRIYHAATVTAAVPRHRLGRPILRFVGYQQVALGRRYGNIQHALRTSFGLTVRVGELPRMVAEMAARCGPADARLLDLMRQQAALHGDAPRWRINGVPHGLWVFVNAVVAL